VHSDVKLKNVLVKIDEKKKFDAVKLSGFAYCFKYDEKMQISSESYEYLPPEIFMYHQYIA